MLWFTIILKKTVVAFMIFFFKKSFFKLIFNGPFSVLLNLFSWSIKTKDFDHFVVINGYHVQWYIMCVFTWKHPYLWVVLCEFQPSFHAWLLIWPLMPLMSSISYWFDDWKGVNALWIGLWFIPLAYITHFSNL